MYVSSTNHDHQEAIKAVCDGEKDISDKEQVKWVKGLKEGTTFADKNVFDEVCLAQRVS